MRQLLLIFFVYICWITNGTGQINNSPKPWMIGQFPSGLNPQIVHVIQVEGSSLDDVWNKARIKLVQNVVSEKGPAEITVEEVLRSVDEVISIKGKPITGTGNDRSDLIITARYKNVHINYNLVDEYYKNENDKYNYWALFEISVDGKPLTFPRIKYTDDYGYQAVWRSATIPGWGQFYKKKTGRGITLLASEVLLISTTVYFEQMRSDNMRKSAETLNLDIIKEYRNRADTWELGRNIAIGGAIAVYALNLLDAALGKGQLKYAFIPGNIDLLAYKDGNINQFGLKITF